MGVNIKAGSDFESEILYVNRVAKVVKGGRRFSFEVIVAIGDKKGIIGIGKGKAQEIPDATSKANQDAKKAFLKVPLKQERTTHHDIEAKAGACKIIIRSAPPGRGIISGGAVRTILSLVGMRDIVTKIHGSRNVHAQINAIMKALKDLTSPKYIARRRNKPINEIIAKREALLASKKMKNMVVEGGKEE